MKSWEKTRVNLEKEEDDLTRFTVSSSLLQCFPHAHHHMKKYGIHAKLIRLILNLYSAIASFIFLEGEETNLFKFRDSIQTRLHPITHLISHSIGLHHETYRKSHCLGTNCKPNNTEDAK